MCFVPGSLGSLSDLNQIHVLPLVGCLVARILFCIKLFYRIICHPLEGCLMLFKINYVFKVLCFRILCQGAHLTPAVDSTSVIFQHQNQDNTEHVNTPHLHPLVNIGTFPDFNTLRTEQETQLEEDVHYKMKQEQVQFQEYFVVGCSIFLAQFSEISHRDFIGYQDIALRLQLQPGFIS